MTLPLVSRRLRDRELLALDAVLAVALALLCGYAASEATASGWREPLWLSWLVGSLIGLPLAVRRRWPVATAGVVLVASVASLLTGVVPDYAATGPALALACSLYLVGVAVPGRSAVFMLLGSTIATGVVLFIVSTARHTLTGMGEVAFVAMMVAAAWVLGRAVRDRRAYAGRAADRRTERAVSEERLRIARELHDIVAHSMSLIAVKAAVANHVAEERPEETREALRVIEATSRAALTDMRRTLGLLRTGHESAPESPTGATGLQELAERTRSAGIPVDLTVTGNLSALPEGIGRAVHRIVQESLTNVVRHAAPATCRVTVVAEAGQVSIDVSNSGTRGAPAHFDGQGIAGMRERVKLHDGQFAAGPLPEGGFAVSARIPYDAS